MFTGIVEEIGRVESAGEAGLVVAASKVLEGTRIGDSLAVNGVCLTVTRLTVGSFTAQVMPETQRRTALGGLRRGDSVNLERAATLSSFLGGHLVQGHVDGVGHLESVTREGDSSIMTFTAPAEVLHYIVVKGFIAVDGISLTVTALDARSFSVSVAAFTREHTNMAIKRSGDPVNLESDIIAKYVEKFASPPGPGITADFLAEHGFNSS